ncbi:catechol 2,3-dioxygenase-like lactoylglutathione lyase family enzyme [Angulomicrobium tetraedrale]|uniref:Catechol 2,3-dioxygenase-like lactoylglutathione lyase family enzyme n=1 Tax=Ancylobacter tetraedralis TaxID=217068 RepID=A0A839Z8X7_9HYPH|nr:catechol 2,3-dioxygenase-like lactoylglutathione lyase family enzyme [Ancylobacter tetraedralis]
MARGLDHVVHVVRDLEAAGELYDMLGFTVGARNRHPWGTHNRLIQTPGFFVELLEVADPEAIPPHEDGKFSFGAFNRDFLDDVGQGLSMLVLEGRDPAADKEAFDTEGFGGFELFDFARTGKRPDGSDVEVAFTLAYARDPASPHTGFFTCKQLRPENFWAPDLQRHMNTTTGVAGVVLAAAEPERHLPFLAAFTDAPFRRAVDGWHIAKTPRGDVDLMSHALFTERFGVAAPPEEGLRLVATRFAVSDIDKARKRVASSRMAAEEIEGIIVISAQAGLGATLVFEPAA